MCYVKTHTDDAKQFRLHMEITLREGYLLTFCMGWYCNVVIRFDTIVLTLDKESYGELLLLLCLVYQAAFPELAEFISCIQWNRDF
jgi:hypothetical protein